MKKRRRKGPKEYIINYEDLPTFAFKSDELQIDWTNQSVTNIPPPPPEKYELKGKVMATKIQHNTNCRPRNKAEYRKRKSSEVIFSEVAPCRIKRKMSEQRSKSEQTVTISQEENFMEMVEQRHVEEIITPISSETSQSSETDPYIEELSEYDNPMTIEQFEKILQTFNVPPKCKVYGISKYKNLPQLQQDTKEMQLVIFPFMSKNKYGLIAFVDRINISGKERKKCMVHVDDGKTSYPTFMKEIHKELTKIFELPEEPIIHTIHINKYGDFFKHNGYFNLFLIECMMKKRVEDSTGQSKLLSEYITPESMLESFKKYKEI